MVHLNVGSAFLLTCLSMVWITCSQSPHQGTRDTTSTKFTQYYRAGEELYTKHCGNCHQSNGSGLGRVYPPLNKSNFMKDSLSSVICLMRYGKKGEVSVNDVNYVQTMPDNTALTDLDIAEIATYIYNTWENKHGLIEVKEVSEVLKHCGQH